jgi:hypothetical protein
MPGSARALRRTYGRLHVEGHVDNKATILVRAGKKFAAENKILSKENEGLRGAIFEKNRKRKCGKPLNFYEEGEKEGKALFFSPAKSARTRERAAAQEEAELQQKRTAEDKKL